MEQPDLESIAAQLRQPAGKDGLEIAERMSINNGNMIHACIDHLCLKDKDRVLETGPGGGLHVPYLLKKAKGLSYTGADISDTMITLANGNNEALVKDGVISFLQVAIKDGYATLPFADHSFDILFTVNTLYFWDAAAAQARELYRVLQPGGIFALCFATETFMSSLPFTQYGFNLYTEEKASALLETAGFRINNVHHIKEVIPNHNRQELEREFMVMMASK